MATIFNANTTEGLVITPDTSGEMVFQSNGTQVLKVTGATGSFDVPVGTTAERPASPSTGTIRYNTTEGALETYDGSSWTSVGASTWTTSGSDIYYNTGKVGIGTSSPDGNLHVDAGVGNDGYAIVSGGTSATMVINGDTDNSGDASSSDAKLVFTGDGSYDSSSNSGFGSYSYVIHQLNQSGASSLAFTETRGAGTTYERMRIDNNGNLKFNSGYGSVATAYGCRAWVTYNAQTNTILADGNVSSVTDHATGQFTVNFSTAMPDVNYAACGIVGQNDSTAGNHILCEYSPSRTTSSARVVSGTAGNTETDEPYWTYIAFR